MKTIKIAFLCGIILLVYACDKENSIKASEQLNNNTEYTYEPTITKLKGRIINRDVYGPPNFGSNPKIDKKYNILILILNKPINVKADIKANFRETANLDSFKNIKEIQLSFNSEDFNESSFKKYIGKEVIIEGTLSQRIVPSEYTQIIMEVHKTSLVK